MLLRDERRRPRALLTGVPVFVEPQATDGALLSAMKRLEASGYKLAAGRFANRIQSMVPGRAGERSGASR